MEYTVNAKQAGAALFKDASAASKMLLDIVDDKIHAGALEPIEDAVAAAVQGYLAQILAKVQDDMGPYGKFAGDVFDDADAAVAFLLAQGDELVKAGSMEPLMDAAASLAQPYLVAALRAKQAKLAAVTITAED